MSTDPRIEAAARAICAAQFPDVNDTYTWNVQFEDGKEEYRAEAAAALAAADAVDPLRQPGHRVEISEDSWTLQHPPECRSDMLACPLNVAIRGLGLTGVPDGVYAVELTADGSLLFPDEVAQ